LSEWALLAKAVEVAAKAHEGVKRADGLPYIVHPVRMAFWLIERHGLEDGVVLATIALLHDVVEDTDVTQEDILEMFPDGDGIAVAVDALTRKPDSGETYMDFVRRAANNWRARKVKRADVFDNMINVDTYKPGLRKRYERALKILDSYGD
jgi:(p)ppGpp synthase/HD superfamily hydrolase